MACAFVVIVNPVHLCGQFDRESLSIRSCESDSGKAGPVNRINSVMKKTKAKPLKKAWMTAVLGAAGGFGVSAYGLNVCTNLPPVSPNGFGSQGFLVWSGHNYLDTETRNCTFRFPTARLSASVMELPCTYLAEQTLTEGLGTLEKFEAILDYALGEYASHDCFEAPADGLSQSQGNCRVVTDGDLTQPCVLLAPGVTDLGWRDDYLLLNGGEDFGMRLLNEAEDTFDGNYAGEFSPALDLAAIRGARNYLPPNVEMETIHSATEGGGQFWWNSPIHGLRAGPGGGCVFGFAYDTPILTGDGNILLPRESSHITFLQGSLEYLWQAWTFQTGFYAGHVLADSGVTTDMNAWSANASYRFTHRFSAGACYTDCHDGTDESGDSRQHQNDLALTVRFDPTSWWSFKLEGHYVRGSGLLDEGGNSSSAQDDHGWFLLAVKTNLSF